LDNSNTWEEVFASTYKGPPAGNVYCIAITARSGSTWLGDLLARSRLLGDPREYFNINAAQYSIHTSGCGSLGDYYRYLRTLRRSGDVFGFEASYYHLEKLIDEGYEEVIDSVGNWFMLRRRNYVAQSVSLYRAKSTGVFHSTQKQGDAIPEVPYDAYEIGRRLLGLMTAEFKMNRLFESRGISPVELWYEDLLNTEPEQIVDLFVRQLGIDTPADSDEQAMNYESSFEKLADNHSDYLIARFEEENPAMIAFWNTHRGEKPIRDFILRHPSYAHLTGVAKGASAAGAN